MHSPEKVGDRIASYDHHEAIASRGTITGGSEMLGSFEANKDDH